MDLKCKKLDCEYNKKYSCKKKHIMVSTKDECHSYAPAKKERKGQQQDSSLTMFEAAPSFEPFRHSKTVDIICHDSGCLFNCDKCCKANGITISHGKKATCLTQVDKCGVKK